MKLVNYQSLKGPLVGLVRGNDIVDLSGKLPEASSMETLIEGGEDVMVSLRLIEREAPASLPLKSTTLLAPLRRPQKFLAIGMNYKKHIVEANAAGIPTPKFQYWFNKQVSCLNDPYGSIVMPAVSDKLDYEVELGVVIGRAARGVRAGDARNYIFGYTVCNDVSVRDWQAHTPTMTMGKSFDTHGPVGPWIVTADEIPDPHALGLRCMVNGVTRQESNTSELVYNCFEMIEYLSTAFTLAPGDLLATGTPEGVGAAMKPPGFLKVGDVVRCEVDGIGSIENTVIASY